MRGGKQQDAEKQGGEFLHHYSDLLIRFSVLDGVIREKNGKNPAEKLSIVHFF